MTNAIEIVKRASQLAQHMKRDLDLHSEVHSDYILQIDDFFLYIVYRFILYKIYLTHTDKNIHTQF